MHFISNATHHQAILQKYGKFFGPVTRLVTGHGYRGNQVGAHAIKAHCGSIDFVTWKPALQSVSLDEMESNDWLQCIDFNKNCGVSEEVIPISLKAVIIRNRIYIS